MEIDMRQKVLAIFMSAMIAVSLIPSMAVQADPFITEAKVESMVEDIVQASPESWKAAYLKYLNDKEVPDGQETYHYYWLKDIDSDNIPEMKLHLNKMEDRIVSYKNGQICEIEDSLSTCYYLKSKGLIYVTGDYKGEIDDSFYRLDHNGFTTLGKGSMTYEYWGNDGVAVGTFKSGSWNGSTAKSKSEYEQAVQSTLQEYGFDINQASSISDAFADADYNTGRDLRDAINNYQNFKKVESGFTLGRDNNNFSHNNRSENRSGFPDAQNYHIPDEYFKALTSNSSIGEKAHLRAQENQSWGGVCYGISASMALLYNGLIPATDLSSHPISSYYKMGNPKDDSKFSNMITAYQLSQGLKNGGSDASAIASTYNPGIFSDLVNWAKGYNSLSTFLSTLVHSLKNDQVMVLILAYKNINDNETSNHAILLTGVSYDSEDDQYTISLYDPNTVNDTYKQGEFTIMTVSGDYSSFVVLTHNQNISNVDYISMDLLNVDSLKRIKLDESSGVKSYTNTTSITLPMGTGTYTIKNSQGKSLSYDGNKFSGDMTVYSISDISHGDGAEYIIETDNSDFFKLSNLKGDGSFSFTGSDYQTSFEEEGATGATVSPHSIKLTGDNYTFTGCLMTEQKMNDNENALGEISGTATAPVEISVEKSEVVAKSTNPLTNITGTKILGNTTQTSQITSGTTISTNQVNVEKNKFVDVSPDKYYAAAVEWAVKENITSGTSVTTFSPNAACTRAQIVALLYRMSGAPAVSSVSNPFSDVKNSAYYANAVKWAVKNKVTSGTSAKTFSPNAPCTRAQIVSFLWRMKGTPSTAYSGKFRDVKSSAYYASAVSWAVQNNVTKGTSSTTFSPNATCTRAQAVMFLYMSRNIKQVMGEGKSDNDTEAPWKQAFINYINDMHPKSAVLLDIGASTPVMLVSSSFDTMVWYAPGHTDGYSKVKDVETLDYKEGDSPLYYKPGENDFVQYIYDDSEDVTNVVYRLKYYTISNGELKTTKSLSTYDDAINAKWFWDKYYQIDDGSSGYKNTLYAELKPAADCIADIRNW